jgi:type II secretory pathway pseudopilin PulG
MRRAPHSQSGFTLAEAAVTIALVAVTLSVLLQALEGAKLQAAHTRDQKIARELALGTLAQVEAGLWQDDIDFTRSGNYAEEGFLNFWFELAVGDESFADDSNNRDPNKPFDNWAYQREQELDQKNASDDEEEEATEPFEKVRIKVSYPQYGEYVSQLTLERWIPWEQVYGEDEDAAEEEEDSPDQNAGGGDQGAGSGGSQDAGGGGSGG